MTARFRWTCRGIFVLAMLATLAISAQPAFAHAELEHSTPGAGSALASAPSSLDLRFTETVDPELSSISLVAANGVPVNVGPVVVDPGDRHLIRAEVANPDVLDPGVYTVVWGAYSAEDGHASSGSFTFSFGTGEAPTHGGAGLAGASTWSIVGKWLELIGLALLTGLAVFGLASGSPGNGAVAAHRPVMFALGTIALTGAAISFRTREVDITGGSMIGGLHRGTVADLIDSTYGRAWLMRLAALICALAATWLLPRFPRRIVSFLAVCGFAGLGTIALSGHAGAIDRAWLAASVDWVHMSAAGIWLGGLLGLLLTLSAAVESEADRGLLARQGNRFLVAVVIVILAGVASAWWHIDGRRSALQTDYGRTLLIKVAIVAGILGVAWYNRRVLQARPGRPRWIPLAIGVELVLGIVVLLFSADLSQTPPANQPLIVPVAARALEVSQTASSETATISLSGILTGDPTDVVTVTVSPDSDLQRVIVHSSLNTEAGEPVGDRFDATPVDGRPGDFVFPAGRLGIAGPWDLDITIRRAGLEDETITLPIDTSQLAGYGTRSEGDVWGGFRATTHTVLAIVLAALMLGIGLGGLRRITGLEPLASGFLLAASLVIAGGFVVSAARSLVLVTPDHRLTHPVDTSGGAITYAGSLYQANCAVCHGVEGRGVGSSNLAHLHGSSADLTSGSAEAQSDGDLFYWIGRGVPGTRMPAFGQALSDDERWQLVAYLRRLQADAREAEANE
jgi:copper transport protein